VKTSVKKMTYTQTEIVGFGKNVWELVAAAAAVLKKAGFDVDEILRILAEKLEKAAKANARQEEAKREAKAATADVESTHDDLYRSASGYLDAAIGAVGKGSPDAKNFQRLRSRIRMPGDQLSNATTPGGPAPGSQQ